MIYLDNNATTALDPHILDIYNEAAKNQYANPSSPHSVGRQAQAALIQARDHVAAYLGVKSKEIIFTSSGTEALNMVIKGICDKCEKGSIMTSNLEHAAVFETIKQLETKGWQATYLAPGKRGTVTVDMLEKTIEAHTRLIVLMAVNNETGVRLNVEQIAAFAESKKIALVIDGVALLGKAPFSIPLGVSALCFSGHKIHAPKGVGVAFVRRGLNCSPLIIGGEQEHGWRAGTENVPGIVALGEAVKLLQKVLPESMVRMAFFAGQIRK